MYLESLQATSHVNVAGFPAGSSNSMAVAPSAGSNSSNSIFWLACSAPIDARKKDGLEPTKSAYTPRFASAYTLGQVGSYVEPVPDVVASFVHGVNPLG